jgi:hypothetical protein
MAHGMRAKVVLPNMPIILNPGVLFITTLLFNHIVSWLHLMRLGGGYCLLSNLYGFYRVGVA